MGLFHGINQRFTFMLSSSQTSSNNSTNNTYISKSWPRNYARNAIVTNPLHRLASSSSVDKWSRVSFDRRSSPGSHGGSAQNSNPLPFFSYHYILLVYLELKKVPLSHTFITGLYCVINRQKRRSIYSVVSNKSNEPNHCILI